MSQPRKAGRRVAQPERRSRAASGRKKKKVSAARRVGRALYGILVALSAVIVFTWIAVKIIARPPDQSAELPPVAENTPAPGESAQLAESQEPQLERKPYTYTFLLVASDQGSGNTDTMMVLTYDTENQTAGLVSLPRDTMIDGVKQSNGSHFYKLNGTYAYNGIEGLKSEVTKILGIPIDFYVGINMEGFKVLVDELGGIEFNVPVHMAYDDPAQDLHIHYEPGLQHLDGQDVLNVARCRKNSDGEGTYPNNLYSAYPDNDIGRTRTQQQLIGTILKKALSNPQKINRYIEIFLEYVNTNLEFGEMLWFAEPALGFDFENGMTSATLTGDGNTYYPGWGQYCYQLYPEETLETVNQLINPYDQDLTLEDMNIFQYQ